MLNKLDFRMMPTTREIKAADRTFEKCMIHLLELLIQVGVLVVLLQFLVVESSHYDVIIGLPTMIKLQARPDYYRWFLRYI